MMRRMLLAIVSIALLSAAANAADRIWIAACYSDKNLQYNQTLDGKGFLFLETGEGDYMRMALVQKFYDGKVICSVTTSTLPGSNQYLKVCADRINGVVTVQYTAPTGTAVSIKGTAPYCKAAVTVH